MTKAKIQIVEDESIIAMELEQILSEQGYNVTAISNTGKSAIANARQGQPELILMDIHLKGDLDGIQTAEIIISELNTPIIFLTAHAEDENVKRAIPILPYGYLLKPVQERDLKVAVELGLYAAKIEKERKIAQVALQVSMAETEGLLNSARTVLQYQNFQKSASFILECLKELTRAEMVCFIFFPECELEEKENLIETGNISCSIDEDNPIQIQQIRALIVDKNTTFFINDCEDSKWNSRIPEGMIHLKNMLFTPIILNKEKIGLMVIGKSSSGFSNHDATLTDAFGDLLSLALYNKQLIENYKKSENRLQDAHNKLEIKVNQRTEELYKTNQSLQGEIDDRKLLEIKLQNNEKKYRELVENTDDLISQIDNKGKIVFVNGMANHYLGTSPENCIGKDAVDYIQSNDKKVFIQYFETWNLEKPNSTIIENRQINQRTGKIFDMRWTVNLHYDDQGNFKYFNGIAQDISKQKEIEKKLHEAKEIAEFANQSKSDFLSNISHEIRTPMHQILSFSQLGVKKITTAKPEKLLHYFSKIGNIGRNLMVLLNDLLDLSKLESGKIEYQFENNDLCLVTKNVAEEFHTIITENEINFVLQEPNTDLEFWFDEVKIGQVIRNLLSNALKFTPAQKSIYVQFSRDEIAVKNDDGDESMVAVVITQIIDEGLGIPPKELDTVFNKFIQSSNTKKIEGGTGLGLAICKQIVNDHHGKIWAEQNSEGGTIFNFALPFTENDLEH